MANNFVYTWTSGHQTDFKMPSTSGGCNSENPNETSHNNAIVNLVGGDDPTNYDMTIPQVAINYLEDKAMYLVQAISTAEAYLDVASNNKNFWDEREKSCDDWDNWTRSCKCCNDWCYLKQSKLKDQYSYWKALKTAWIDCVQDLKDLLVVTNDQIETIQGQSLNTAGINEAIASANYSIAYAKGMEVDVEKQERISKFITLIVPILIVILLIGLVIMWRKK